MPLTTEEQLSEDQSRSIAALIREEANFGDPRLDPVLTAAIRTAQARYQLPR